MKEFIDEIFWKTLERKTVAVPTPQKLRCSVCGAEFSLKIVDDLVVGFKGNGMPIFRGEDAAKYIVAVCPECYFAFLRYEDVTEEMVEVARKLSSYRRENFLKFDFSSERDDMLAAVSWQLAFYTYKDFNATLVARSIAFVYWYSHPFTTSQQKQSIAKSFFAYFKKAYSEWKSNNLEEENAKLLTVERILFEKSEENVAIRLSDFLDKFDYQLLKLADSITQDSGYVYELRLLKDVESELSKFMDRGDESGEGG